MKKDFIKNKQKGFTLVETLVAIFIFVLSTTALVVVTGNSVSDVSIAKNKLVARALSEEGIEMVRNIRDTSSLSNPGATGWTVFKDLMQDCTSSCIINNPHNFFSGNNPDPVITACPSVGCQALARDDDGLGYFEYGGPGEITPFRRSIIMECVDDSSCTSANEVKITSTVYWKQGSIVKNVSATEHLFNWITN